MVSGFKYLPVFVAFISLAVISIGCSERLNSMRFEEPATETADSAAFEGEGPGEGGDQYDYIPENPFEQVSINPYSTFSIDVDTASYSKMRMYLMQQGQLPPAGAIRLEEWINYFNYEYPEPEGEHPVATHVEIASCPWQPGHRLVRIGLQARHIDLTDRPPCNLVFLLDVSGSMDQANKLPLMKAGFERFVRQLRADDRVAIVVYAGSSGLALPSTSGGEQEAIIESLNRLKAGGSTNGGEGIALAYRIVQDNFMEEGINRILLCTDGDFNVGLTNTAGLVEFAAEKAKGGIYLSVLGFGMGNHNDAMLETLSNNAEGNYAFIDTLQEAKKVLVEQMSGTLITVARDVKIQVEFNPALVQSYRLIGYENRMLAEEDFNNDEKDAGEIGAGHSVTALYELVPMGIDDTASVPSVAPFRYQQPAEPTEEATSGEMLTVNLRYKLPDATESTLIDQHVMDDDLFFNQASADFQFAAAVAEFGMLLRHSQHAGDANYAEILELATDNIGDDKHGYRREFVELIKLAAELTEQQATNEEN